MSEVQILPGSPVINARFVYRLGHQVFILRRGVRLPYRAPRIMERIHLDNTHSVGLGDNLCLMSLLATVNEPVELYVSNDHNTYNRLCQYKKIFKISDEKLKIVLSDCNGDFANIGWPLKLMHDYYKPLVVHANGIDIPTKPLTERRCIAVAGFFDNPPVGNNNEWPWCKHRPLDYWSKIYAWLKSIRYEVITVDYAYHNLENKIELMTKHCAAVISYEGGMAHLGHMLSLPVFMVDWTYPTPSTTLDKFHCEFVHRTNSMYILRDDNELFSWDESKFGAKINELRHGISNNRLVNGECRIDFRGPGIYGPLTVKDKLNNTLLSSTGLFDPNSTASQFVSKFSMRV